MMASPASGSLSPAFLLARDLAEGTKLDKYDLCVAVSEVVGRGAVLGAHGIKPQ